MKKSGFVRVLAFVLLLTLTACTAAVPTNETAGNPAAAAADMHHTMQKPVFTFRDPADYKGVCDMTIPDFRDIWEICRDGSVSL